MYDNHNGIHEVESHISLKGTREIQERCVLWVCHGFYVFLFLHPTCQLRCLPNLHRPVCLIQLGLPPWNQKTLELAQSGPTPVDFL